MLVAEGIRAPTIVPDEIVHEILRGNALDMFGLDEHLQLVNELRDGPTGGCGPRCARMTG